VHEVALLAFVVLVVAVSARLLRDAGPLPHWLAGWAAAGLAGFLPLVESALPRLQPIAHPLGTLYAALLLAGALRIADRPIPLWLFPAALAFGATRAVVADGYGAPAGYALGLACEPFAVLAGGWIAIDAARRPGAPRSLRLLGPSLVLLALAGLAHLAWLAAGRPPAALAPLWVVVAPIALGVQVHAAGDALRRRVEERLARRVAERTRALAASEERWRAVSALSTDFAFKVRIDRDLRLTRDWVSGGFARTLGLDPSALDGTGWLRLLGPETRDRALPDLDTMRRVDQIDFERELVRADGGSCWVQLHLETLETTDDGTLHVLGAGRDVTERKEAEAERTRLARHLEQVQRLESLGILVGGIAHDFNNLLTVIRGSARLALDDLPRDAAARPRIERIAAAAEHAAELTEEMLAYAGKAPTALVALDVSALARATADLLRASLPAGCELALELDSGLPLVDADAGGVRRVLLNLVLNAAESLAPEGGRVTLSTRLADVGRGELDAAFGTAGLEPGRFVAIEVRDTGCGMDEATAARIFEPFFSTKFTGRGLGMAAVLGIVQAHHGAIRVDSAPGSGTRVRVLLPPGARESAAAVRSVAEPGALQRGRVLVVDDDPDILELACEVLRRAGHAPVAAGGGAAALEALRGMPEIEVALIDLAMPDMSGEELFVRLRAERPGLCVILVTGFDPAHAAARFGSRGLDAFLRKPWEPEALVAAVQQAVGRSGAERRRP
jgi:PAS domain S-box-containing protein